ncbi:MAG: glycogen synthase [Leptospiraceae bacterium]|nr:glycogen synthase [Leptospiraceae bacterium]MCP5513573.1 glycogen synthase [Leptospiraceae bacterium]
MKILHTAAEFFPYIKVGGLSDMLASLSKYQSKNNEVHIALPLLESIRPELKFLKTEIPCIADELRYNTDACKVLEKSKFRKVKHGKINLYFFDSPLFSRYDKIYGNTDELYSFAIFSYACYYLGIHLDVDVVHSHDWHTSLVSVINNTRYPGKPTVFTIHNLAFQGDHPFWMTSFLRTDPFHIPLESIANYEKVNYMKGALQYTQEITTVSRGYRDEILHEPQGLFLSWILNQRIDSFTGIMNGVDEKEWNPKSDKKIYKNYTLKTVEKGKRENKEALYKEFGLPVDPERPLIGMVSRLTHQKGFETFLNAFLARWNLPFFYFILGTGDKELEGRFFHESHFSNHRLFFYKGFDETLARKIEAASDFFLMPSLFEPCGLNQMYSQVYGTVPIVSRVGGLKDSVREDPDLNFSTGLVFEPGQDHSLAFALDRASTLYYNKDGLHKVRSNIMNLDWSWKNSEMEYHRIYEKAISKKLI